MSEQLSRWIRFTAFAIAAPLLTACSSFDAASTKAIGVITPYKMDIVQGNVVTREQFALIKPGMQRTQVRDVMGTALITSVFRADRWDYVFSLKSQTAQNQLRKVTVYFKGDVVDRTEGDELPSETEFVSTLRSWVKPDAKPPVLEASEETLKKYPPPAPRAPVGVATAVAPTSYPPLESATR